MENLSTEPGTTNVSYSTNVGSHCDSEVLEKFPESSHRENKRGIVKDIGRKLKLESYCTASTWRADGTQESWGAVKATMETRELTAHLEEARTRSTWFIYPDPCDLRLPPRSAHGIPLSSLYPLPPLLHLGCLYPVCPGLLGRG